MWGAGRGVGRKEAHIFSGNAGLAMGHTGLGALGLSRVREDWEKMLEGFLGNVTSEWGAQ